jgi:hypothetical protein
MKKLLTAAVMVALFLAPLAAIAGAGEWTGYVTDTHCAKNGAGKEHTAECVEKCMKGGSKAQIWNDSDQKAYTLDSFDKVKPLMGSKVTVKGKLDAATNTITVESAARAEEKAR